MSVDALQQIIRKHSGQCGEILSILEDVQAKYSYLPREALEEVAAATGRSLVDIYGVATFYKLFTFKPRGEHLVSVCLGTACHVRRAPIVAEEFERRLGVEPGETTPDRQVTLETVNCVGACALGPIVVVDGHYFPNCSKQSVKGILDRTRSGLDQVELRSDPRVIPVEVRCPHCNHSLMDPNYPIDGRPSVRVTIAFGGGHGCLRLSSYYGSYASICDHEVPEDAVAHLFCPHCHAELIGAGRCLECATTMVPMIVEGGGIVQICPRRGCKGHLLDL
ncbi:MAG: NAD(P)H-dependent oxidoreductase subunit E [Candidatus Riflebacteria bacterium]|nr:NAD(P)H-dependent oxidoreductase subunit E [Candidatus Riflebacteria bacterium]